jgi:hypothetical protein
MLLVSPIWESGPLLRDLQKVFVVMPFKEPWSEYIYKDYICPPVAAAGLKPVRADEMYGRNVLQDIWKGIYTSRFVIADVSVPNENVFYELGIAHSIGKKVVLLTQAVDRIPFDLRTQRMVAYADNHRGYQQLNTELPKHIEAILAEPVDEVHHVRSILGGFVVESGIMRIELDAANPASARVLDQVNIIGARKHTVLLNKAVEFPGHVNVESCDHRFVSEQYPDHIRVIALFDAPYLTAGQRKTVTFIYSVKDGFVGDQRFAPYTIGVDTEKVTLELVVPKDYRGHAKIVRQHKHLDLENIPPDVVIENDRKVFRAVLEHPAVEATYGIRWT